MSRTTSPCGTPLRRALPQAGRGLGLLLVPLLLTACGGGGENARSGATARGDSPSIVAPGAPEATDVLAVPDITAEPETSSAPDTNSTSDTPAAPQESVSGASAARSGLARRPSLAGIDWSLEGTGESGYRLVPVYPRLPDFLEALRALPVPGQNRMLVVEQAGRIKVFDDDSAVSETETVLDISARAAFSSEQGLLGFALDPAFERNRFVYLYYTKDNPLRSVVTRMRWDALADRIDAAGERTLLEVAQPFAGHNGGALEFGPDGYLYLSLGDGGDGGDPLDNAQDLSSLLGKVLRIDVHPAGADEAYAIPADNPFVGVAGARPEIYALGFRNPYRFSFDRQTGELWLGDVGQGEREEIDVIESGGNYGWRVLEGTHPHNGSSNTLPASAFTPPVHEYGHDQGRAVIGGYVYRGSGNQSLFGRYVYADFVSGNIWALTRNADGVVDDLIGHIESPTGFAESRDGEVLVISRYDGLFRFEPVAAVADTAPGTLSATGLFDDVGSLTPIEGLIEYAPAHPFWSDGVGKRRWLGIPDGSRIGFSGNDWTFPVGTVSVKHFHIDELEGDGFSRRRLETRVLVHTEAGWKGYSYHWGADQLDATLANERRTEWLTVRLASGGSRGQLYEYPSRADCVACHTRAAGYLLGPRTAQLNSPFAYPDGVASQLVTFAHVGLFDRDIGEVDQLDAFAPIGDGTRTVEARARAYLDVNCSSCHRPGGPAPSDMDLRAGADTAKMNVVGVEPSAGTLGITGARIVAPGNRQSSVLWQRLRRTDEKRMPPLSTHVVDAAAVRLIGDWIDALRR